MSLTRISRTRISRISIGVALLLVAGQLPAAVGQTAGSATSSATKPSSATLSLQKLKDMKARWSANKPKLKACRQEVKAKGLAGDDRWFYIEDCMSKT
ncbi:hypothetical protein LQG66_31905 [Bradyrhizobium ontarionense]|uniref:Uncharacterized protein n=1 Tax=Bradyrhizobium ontarionense TaxID=2898149 RepID=A0ABY3R8T2_9BRAD|nr:hypothetical protein [Bradyrhizobium sp. A19]UFZ03760.1 hypothetical protein LQG66_31905 [Bradyrhizobium sp. A19]